MKRIDSRVVFSLGLVCVVIGIQFVFGHSNSKSAFSSTAVATVADALTSESLPTNTEPRQAGDAFEITINGVRVVFRYCPPGTFLMGNPNEKDLSVENVGASERNSWKEYPDEEILIGETLHEATLTKGFWLLETPVTQRLWKVVTGDNPSKFVGENLPVESVSWEDCARFLKLLNELGFAPHGLKFDFPTETEWEYSCRAGTTTNYNFGDDITSADANFGRNEGKTTPVKTYKPNAWGLYDMHGNVFEWCSDGFEQYPASAATDPVGPAVALFPVIRGGAWNSTFCGSSQRACEDPSVRSSNVGFRLVLREADKVVSPENASAARDVSPINAPKAGDALEVAINGVKVVFRYCPSRTFLMGSPASEEDRESDETQHEVTLTKGYWLLETPVTQAFWLVVMAPNPEKFKGVDISQCPCLFSGGDYPVEKISWNDCVEFVKKLNESGVAPQGLTFDFPTEAEWESACRADATTRYNLGDVITPRDANFGRSFSGRITKVKSYPPNAWGLYDMHGNVYEWCSDRYGDYSTDSATDPIGAEISDRRVMRGGSRASSAKNCRSAYRSGFDPKIRYDFGVGFRLALRAAE